MQVLLDNGADPLVTGILHLNSWYDCHDGGYYSRTKKISNVWSSEGGFGAGDDICPLIAAASFALPPCHKIVEALLMAGADVHQRTAIGQTALHMICTACSGDLSTDDVYLVSEKEDHLRSVTTLLEHGAVVNDCDDFGKTPLHYAALSGNRYTVKCLVQNGANVHLEDKDGLTALEYVSVADCKWTLALIDKYDFSTEKIIQAYECAALDAESPYDLLEKATMLRIQHKIPKRLLPPTELYGFLTEWETIEDLESCRNDQITLNTYCHLARERISEAWQFYMKPHGIPACE